MYMQHQVYLKDLRKEEEYKVQSSQFLLKEEAMGEFNVS